MTFTKKHRIFCLLYLFLKKKIQQVLEWASLTACPDIVLWLLTLDEL